MATITAPTALDIRTAIARRSSRFFWGTLRLGKRKPLGAFGAVIMILLVIMGAFGPLMAPHDPTETGVVKKYRGPAWDGNLLGGDRFGRDVLSRLLHGARVSLIVGVGASVAGCLFGAGMGLVAGYAGGKTDYALERVTDIILAFPVIILAMALLSGLPRTIPTIILAIAIPTAPFCGRVVRATALVIKESQYIEAARAIGSNPWRIIFLHVAPGCFAPFLVITTSLIGAAILTEAFLGFLGLSVAPPQPTWGEMLAKATTELTFAAHLSIAPGIMITLAVFAFNVLGDTLRDLLDPRLRGKV